LDEDKSNEDTSGVRSSRGSNGPEDKPDSSEQQVTGEEELNEEEEAVARDLLQTSVLPMYQPTVESRNSSDETPVDTLWNLVLYTVHIDPGFNFNEFKEGLEQARYHISDCFAKGDIDAIGEVASDRVTDAYRETKKYWDNSEDITHEYNIESVENIQIMNARFVVDRGQFRGETKEFESWNWAERLFLSPLVFLAPQYPPLEGRIEVDVGFIVREKIEARKKGKLCFAGTDKSHEVFRAWRFTRNFSPKDFDPDETPWVVSDIIVPTDTIRFTDYGI